jgi:hypothetical protein
MGWYGLDSFGSTQGRIEGSCEQDNEPSGSLPCWELLELLSDWKLLKKDLNPLSYLLIYNR